MIDEDLKAYFYFIKVLLFLAFVCGLTIIILRF